MPNLYLGTNNEQISGLFFLTLKAAPGATYLTQAQALSPVNLTQALIAATGATTTASLAQTIQANLGIPAADTAATATILSYLGNSLATAGQGLITFLAAAVAVANPSNSLYGTYGTYANNLIASLETGLAYSLISTNNSTNVATLQAAVGSANAPVVSTFTLTTGIDTVTGASNIVVNAADAGAAGTTSTWTALDSIALTGTNNTYNVASVNAISQPSGAVVNGVQTANFSDTGAAITLDTTVAGSWSGLTQINTTETAAYATSVTAAATTSVSETASIAGAALTVIGGNNISVKGVGDAVTIGFNTVAGGASPVGTITVSETSTAAAAVNIFGGTTVSVTDTGVTTGAITIGSATVSPTGAVTVSTTAAAGQTSTIGTTTIVGGTTVSVTQAAATVAGSGFTPVQGAVSVTGTTATTSVSINDAKVATDRAAVTAVAGVVQVNAVANAPGQTPVTAVTGVTPINAVTAVAGTGISASNNIADKVAANSTTATGGTTTGGTITTVTLANLATANNISSPALTTLNLSGTGGAVNLYEGGTLGATNTTLALNVNGLSSSAITDNSNQYTTLNITTAGTKSTLGTITDTALTTINVAGTAVASMAALGSSVTAVNVTGSAGYTGAITDTAVTFNAAGTTGTSTITIAADATKAITAGTGSLDEIIANAAGGTFTAAKSGVKVTGFEVLGIRAATTGTTDTSVFGAAINKIDVSGADGVSLTSTLTKINTGAAISFAANTAATTYTLAAGFVDTNGASDSVTVTVGGATSANTTSGVITNAAQAIGLTLTDANAVTVGTVNFVDTNVGFGYAGDTVTLATGGYTALGLSGVGGLTLGAFTNTATSLTVANTGTNAAGFVIGTVTDNTLGNVTFTGTGTTAITLSDSVAGTLNLTNSGTGTVTVNGGTLSAATLNLTGAMTFTGTDSSLSTLALSANQTVTLTDALTTGITISGANDNSRVALTLGAAATTKTNTVTLGNGNNSVTDVTTAGTVNVTVGTGSNVLTLGTVASNTAGSFAATVGAHTTTATTGLDQFVIGAAGTNFATLPSLVVTGAVNGDQLVFWNDAGSLATALTATVLTGASTVAGAISTLETAATTLGIHGVTYGVYQGNTYVVEHNAAGAASGTVSTVAEFIGSYSLTASNGFVTLGATATTNAVNPFTTVTTALAVSEVYSSNWADTFTITQAAGGAGASVTLTATGANGTVDLTGATGTSTINTSATSGAFTLTGAGSIDTITVGTGATTVIGAAAADVITLSAGHTAIDTILYNAANQGGAAAGYLTATVAAAGDVVTNFVVAQDVVNFNGVVTGGHTAATFTQGTWNATTNGVGILTGTYAASGATDAVLSSALGALTVAAGKQVVFLIETVAASGIYNAYELNSTAPLTGAGALLSTTDGTISLIGTFSGTAANWTTANVVA